MIAGAEAEDYSDINELAEDEVKNKAYQIGLGEKNISTDTVTCL